MNTWSHRLLAGVIAGLLAGAVGAQTSSPSSTATTDQNTVPGMQTPAPGAGQSQSHPAARMSHSGHMKSKHSTKHSMHNASSSRSSDAERTAMHEEKEYHDALRHCVKEQDSSRRDSCLDGAIDHYHRNG